MRKLRRNRNQKVTRDKPVDVKAPVKVAPTVFRFTSDQIDRALKDHYRFEPSNSFKRALLELEFTRPVRFRRVAEEYQNGGSYLGPYQNVTHMAKGFTTSESASFSPVWIEQE